LTTYSYSVVSGSPTVTVTQNAQAASNHQTRVYTYDLLGRLISEQNPESGISTYTYDTADAACGSYSSPGDLVEKHDAAGNVICTQFDAFHRQVLMTYPSGPNASVTPARFFQYDNPYFGSTGANIKGRLVAAGTCQSPTSCAGNSVTLLEFGYSPRGEVTDVWESTPNSGGMYHVQAGYWQNGNLNTLAGFLASGSTFMPTETYSVDGEGRWQTVSASSGPNPVLSATYNTASEISAIQYGSTDTDSFQYDNAGRMHNYTFTVNGSSEVGVPTWNGNGTLASLAITDPFNASDVQTCNYGYDDLARILSANCGAAWSQTFSYDVFGNLTKSGSLNWQPGYNLVNNRYTLAGTSYDANGNLTNDTFRTYAWDSNGRPTSIGSKTMTYDAFGRMVEKFDGAFTQFVYSPSGSLLARMSAQSATSVRVPLPGSWAVYGASSSFNHYEHLDWLGNSRLSSSQSRTMTSDIAYAPFGEAYASTATSGVSFTGMRSDVAAVSGAATNGLYDFLARELPPTQGRWISPDPAGLAAVNFTNPQSFNRYAYVGNTPMNATDPVGLLGFLVNAPALDPGTLASWLWEVGTSGVQVAGADSVFVDGGCIGCLPSIALLGIDLQSLFAVLPPIVPGEPCLVGAGPLQIGQSRCAANTLTTESCSVTVSCDKSSTPHCGITVGQNGSYTDYNAEPSTNKLGPLVNPFSNVTLTVQVNGPTAPPGGPGTGNIIFQSPTSCSTANCIQKSADYTNAAELPYSAPNMWGGQNSNWWASNTTSACGLSVNYPWNAIGAN
jgi:RHS repeat-associated protein